MSTVGKKSISSQKESRKKEGLLMNLHFHSKNELSAPPGVRSDRSNRVDSGESIDQHTRRVAANRPSLRQRIAHAGERFKTDLQPIWRDQRIGAAIGVVVVGVWGVAGSRWTPRGPLTSAQAVWSIVISLAVGITCGVVTRSRWSMLVAPAIFAAVFEMTRIGTTGPTVDRVHFSTYGILALVVGRGFHALLSLVPMALGASVGAASAKRLSGVRGATTDGNPVSRYARQGIAVATSAAMIVLVAGLARPASTAAIRGSNGKKLPGSIAELRTVNINGHGLAMMIRGHSVKNPVLLFLAGGPGGSEMGALRNHLSKLEERFTVVTFDQRGTGKSYPELDPASTLTLNGAIDDVTEVTNYLRVRFKQEKIYLSGQSWGSSLGVLALQKQPSAYRAFIGVGQMVSQLATDRIFYKDTVAWARRTKKNGLASKLLKIGPPPYANMLNYESTLSYEHEMYPYDHTKNSEGEGGFSENFIVNEYALIDQVHLLGGFMDTFSVLYPRIQNLDFRVNAKRFSVPMYFVQGAHEAPGRSIPFKEWFGMIEAPNKKVVEFDTSGHRPLFEQPDKFVEFMNNTVLAETQNK
jgi:proline iminopeptidase